MNAMANRISSIFQIRSEESREQLRKGIKTNQGKAKPLEVPDGAAQLLLDYMLERSYLDDVSDMEKFAKPTEARRGRYIEWIRIDRLPVPPGDDSEYDLLARWQSVLSSLHAWNKKIYFLLKRKNGRTGIYVGMESVTGTSEVHQLHTSLINSMPGISVKKLNEDGRKAIEDSLQDFNCTGAVTGIPSVRKGTKYSVLQTLDQLAFGIRNGDPDKRLADADFALMAIADPICDSEICAMISKFNQLGSDIHSQVCKHISDTDGTTRNVSLSASLGIGAIIALIASMVTGGPAASLVGAGMPNLLSNFANGNPNGVIPGDEHNSLMARGIGGVLNVGGALSQGVSYSHSESYDVLNKFAQYSETITDHHCKRLREGRNLGFWNVGLHVLAGSRKDVKIVLGMLRSVYSGDESYFEPIRIHLFEDGSGAADCVKRGEFVSILNPNLPNCGQFVNQPWHLLGKAYQYVSTPLNTAELSIATSLPRRDVPGIRFVRNAVRFSNNPGDVGKNNSFSIGYIKDAGVEQLTEYYMNVDSLVRHALVTGGTGCGKTTTCKRIIGEVLDKKKNVLIIEPAKDEWARWAAAKKKEGEDINLYMPGMSTLDEQRVSQLKINLFQPAAIEGAPIDLMTHCERVTAMLNRCLPVSDILPIIIDEAIHTYVRKEIGPEFEEDEMPQRAEFPKLEGVLPVACEIVRSRGYEKKIEDNLIAALTSRFEYLTRGKRGKVLNVLYSTPWDELLGKTTVVNLSKVVNPVDRALIMSGILLALREYRASEYEHDAAMRTAQSNENTLRHLTVIEEAHNVLTKPTHDGAEKDVADQFSDMLSEIRSYGEGLMIIDQVPTRLIPDVIKNTHYKIAHRMASPDDYQLMSAALGLRQDQIGVIPLLAQGEAIVLGDRDDAASWVKIEKNSKRKG